MVEVAPVMTFFEWVCSDGFQIGWVSNRGWVVVVVCSSRVWVSNRLRRLFFLSAWVSVCVCVCVCGLC